MRKSIQSIFFLFTFLLFQSCEHYLNVNEDPNSPTKVVPELVLPAGISSVAYVIGGEWQILGAFWSQHWTQAPGSPQFQNIDSYNISQNDYDWRQFGELYTGALNDLEFVRNQAKKDNNWSQYLIATTMQCFTFQLLADLYDKIPFTEALRGNIDNTKPKYDDGPVIYDGLIERLDFALAKKDEFNFDAIKPGAEDLIFGGDMDQWVQFANTLKLKIYLRQCNARPGISEAGIKKMYAEGAEFLSTDAAMTQFTDETERRNPAFMTAGDKHSTNISISNTLLSFLQQNSDPRIDYLMSKPRSGKFETQRALAQGDYLNIGFADGDYDLSKPILKPLDPVYFISLSESYFLQAEALLRFFDDDEGAKTMYQQGIDAHFLRLGLTNSNSVYSDGGTYKFPIVSVGFEQKIRSIIVQKWIAMVNTQGIESFLEQNRTGYPDFYKVAVNNVTNGRFPRRLVWPDSEYSSNPNTPPLQRVFEKVWWDVHTY